jgi:hypothetical protein
MNRKHLSQLFTAFGLTALIISVNTWIAGQGGAAILSIPLLSAERPAQALYGLLLVGALSALTTLTGLIHAHRYGVRWHERIPVVWLARLNTNHWDGKLYQLVIVIMLVFVPLASLYKFYDTLSSTHLCLLDTSDDSLFSENWKTGFPGRSEQVRLVTELKQKPGTAERECAGGVEVFPPIEFIAIFVLDWFATGIALAFLGVAFGASVWRNTKASSH